MYWARVVDVEKALCEQSAVAQGNAFVATPTHMHGEGAVLQQPVSFTKEQAIPGTACTDVGAMVNASNQSICKYLRYTCRYDTLLISDQSVGRLLLSIGGNYGHAVFLDLIEW